MTVHVQPVVRPDACPALVLNADYRPLSYYPLSIWCWQDAIKAVFLDRVNIVSEYDKTVRSPSFEMRLPSVVSLKTYVKPSRHPAFTRFNVFLRDRFTCQYCGDPRGSDLRPRGSPLQGRPYHLGKRRRGLLPLQSRKGDRLPREVEMWPRQKPFAPTLHDLHSNGRLFPPNYLHESWLDYLYWDSELEP